VDRIKKILHYIRKKELDGILVSSKSNVTYLSRFTGDSSFLMITSNRCILLTDGRYTEQARKECHREIEILNWVHDKRYGIETYEYLTKKLAIKRLGFEGHIVTFNTFQTLSSGLNNVELVDIDGAIEKLRKIKDKTEIESIRIACEISDKALELTIPKIKEGTSEIEITASLEYNIRTNGAEGISFDTIVLSGSKTSLLHGKPGNKKLERGDFVLFDFGALYKGYHADISRTFVLGGPNQQQRELFEIIYNAQFNAIHSIKPGIQSITLEKRVKESIPGKYIGNFYPGLGHGVGLEIHEEPFLGRQNEFIFQKNMVITIEPGIYIPDLGGLRVEDTVLVTDDSFEILSKFPRDLMIL